MAEEKSAHPHRDTQVEERAALGDIVMNVVGSGVGAAVGTYVGHQLGKPEGGSQQADPPPPPPKIELPPGVDRE